MLANVDNFPKVIRRIHIKVVEQLPTTDGRGAELTLKCGHRMTVYGQRPIHEIVCPDCHPVYALLPAFARKG